MSLIVEGRSPFGWVSPSGRAFARAVCTELGAEGQRHIVEAMKREGTTDTGLTMQSVAVSTPVEVEPGVFRSTVAVAPAQNTPNTILELGRRPGKGVSRDGMNRLRKWASRKGAKLVESLMAQMQAERGPGSAPTSKKALRERAVESAAFLVARAIRRRGLKAHGFFAKAKAFLDQKKADVVRRILPRFFRRGGA